ncbi:MAG TPA: hypothetical protein EYG88_02760 [Desulfocapsa sulfexigens]|nr:hypothetical protein [Desulfocapsa sulfexigens]
MEYYLRVEGVNLGNFVYDTNDLPTIRGGGLLLLDAVAKVKEKLEVIANNVHAITQGASWGLFRFTPKDNESPLDVEESIVGFLNGDDVDNRDLKYATFVVNILPVVSDPKKFVKIKNQLAALNHWQQMEAPSLSFPGQEDEVCGFSKVLPATPDDKIGNDFMSKSVKARRNYSKDQKRKDFYVKRTEISAELLEFTSDFTELSSDKEQSTLHHKMAVIYIDGNKFGNFQANKCKNEESQNRFDISVREGQNSILKHIIQSALDDETGRWQTDSGKIRLETLLWGGDEIIWVVPAWLGLNVLDIFYQQADTKIIFKEKVVITPTGKKKRKKKSGKTVLKEHKLKHAAGLIFCNHKAPIHRIIQLAKDLAELAKKNTDKNLVAYQVLESFDHAGKNLDMWRSRRTERLGKLDDLFVSPDNLGEVIAGIEDLKKQRSPGFPKRKMYQIIKAIKDENEVSQKKLWKKLDDSHKEILNKLKELFNDSNVMWLHLVDLWDYVGGGES